MQHLNDFFISHNSEDSAYARALFDLMRSINPDWRIFLDCSDEKPLESHEEWRARMLSEAENSRYLVFVASKAEYLKEGNGWLYEEVSLFRNLKATRHRRNSSEKNVAYFGILFGQIDFQKDLYSDAVRGSEYRQLYERQEQLMLSSDDTVSSAAGRIQNKILQIVTQQNHETASEILDKVRAYANLKKAADGMFSEDAIADALLPSFKDTERNLLRFPELCRLVLESDVALLGREGGSGKTTTLTKLFYHFFNQANPESEKSLIPLYIDAKTLSGENYLILRYLAASLFEERTAMTDRFTGETIGRLDKEFSASTSSPRYLLLIDGCNEIPAQAADCFYRELTEDYLGERYRNVRVVLAGRELDERISRESVSSVRLQELSEEDISEYLKANGIIQKKMNRSLLKILSIPMYLKIYADTASDRRIQTKGELLLQFVQWQHEKNTLSASNEEKKALYYIFSQHLLPIVAYHMAMESKGSSFILSQSDLEKLLLCAIDLLGDTDYKRYHGREYREALRLCRFTDYDELDLYDMAMDYFDHTCQLLRNNGQDGYEFIHQIYRDFFCGWYVKEEIKRAVAAERLPDSMSKVRFEKDIMEFTAELLGEGAPRYSSEEEKWDYSCNEESSLIRLPDLMRKNAQTENAVLASNLVELIRYTRNNDFSGFDFSQLNLTQSNLITGIFSRQDQHGGYPASFSGASINRENLFCEYHFATIRAACVQGDVLAVIDEHGVLKFWKKKEFAITTIKVIAEVDYDVYQMLFAPSGESIYLMTAHEILELPISEDYYSKAQPKILFETTKWLRNIRLDEEGELCFTTAFNAFNPKPISNPDCADSVNFYGLNSVAAVNDSKTQLAYGNITGYPGLKIYNYHEETNEWIDCRIGYSRVLDDFFKELEQLLRKLKLYMCFPHDIALTAKRIQTRRSYFTYLQLRFEDCTHDHEKVPEKILAQLLKELKKINIEPFPSQLKALRQLVQYYEGVILKEKAENDLLFFMAGRKINSLEYQKGTDTLLISCVNQFVDSDYAHSLVLELDTHTMQTRFVTRFSGEYQAHSFYSDGKIVVNGESSVTVSDDRRNTLMRVESRPNLIQKFLHEPDAETFYALAPHFIYAFDKSGRCIGGVNSFFGGETALYIARDESGRAYLIKESDFYQKLKYPAYSALVLDLVSLTYLKTTKSLSKCAHYLNTVIIGEKSFKMCGDELTSYENNLRCDATAVCYKLFVNGCDFSDVKGSVANPRDLRLLYRFGAITEEASPKVYETVSDMPSYIPSQMVFEPPAEEEPSGYVFIPGNRLRLANVFKDAQGGNDGYEIKTWRRIHLASYSKNHTLEASDYSVLEWVNRLEFASPRMIYDLMRAGLVDAPECYTLGEKYVAKRMSNTLHGTLRLLCRYVFYTENGYQTKPIFTTTKTFGGALLENTTKETVFETENPAKLSTVAVNRTLALNQWFCLTLARHCDKISRYGLKNRFDTADHFNGSGKVHGYIKLGDHAFFAQAFRCHDAKTPLSSVAEKVGRMCILANHYPKLLRNRLMREEFTQPPVIILIGESYRHCRELYEEVKAVSPEIRKLYTYDSLLISEDAFSGTGNYFEFIEGEPRAIHLNELLL